MGRKPTDLILRVGLNITEQHLKWQVDMAAVHGKAEVIIGK
jgi:UDP-N-acetylmuramoylalanine-D-glutamate ligase